MNPMYAFMVITAMYSGQTTPDTFVNPDIQTLEQCQTQASDPRFVEIVKESWSENQHKTVEQVYINCQGIIGQMADSLNSRKF